MTNLKIGSAVATPERPLIAVPVMGETVNDVLVMQQNAVDRLQMQMAALLKRQEEMGGQFESFEEEAPPPHY